MPRLDEIEVRLRRWARWKPRGASGGLGFATCDMAAERVDGADGAHAVFQEGEEAITDLAVDALHPPELRATVYMVYIEGGSRARKCQRLGIAEATLETRVWAAHRLLARWFEDRRRAAEAERERVERLQRAASAR